MAQWSEVCAVRFSVASGRRLCSHSWHTGCEGGRGPPHLVIAPHGCEGTVGGSVTAITLADESLSGTVSCTDARWCCPESDGGAGGPDCEGHRGPTYHRGSDPESSKLVLCVHSMAVRRQRRCCVALHSVFNTVLRFHSRPEGHCTSLGDLHVETNC